MNQEDKKNEEIDLSKELNPIEKKERGDSLIQNDDLPLPKIPKLVQKIITCSGGLIKNEKQANYLLISFIVLFASLVIFLFINSGIIPSTQVEYTPNTQYQGKNLPDSYR